MSLPLHIVHGVLALDAGGLERLVLSLIPVSRRQGHRVSILCLDRPGEWGEAAQAAGAEVLTFDRASSDEVLRRLKPDVVHSHQLGITQYLAPAARRLKMPVLHTEHGNRFAEATWWQAAKLRVDLRSIARDLDRFCCVSQEIAAQAARFGAVPRNKLEVVRNGIASEAAELSPESMRAKLHIAPFVPVIGSVGRLDGIKCQHLLIHVLAQLRTQFSQAQLVLVGDGPERRALEALSVRLGLADAVHFTGYQPHPHHYLRIMNVFVLPSRSEGSPISLLEAWRECLPAVCTSVGGITEMATHEVNALLVPPDDAGALAAGIGRILSDQALGERLGRAGHDTLHKHYTIEHVARDYEARYRDIMRNASCA